MGTDRQFCARRWCWPITNAYHLGQLVDFAAGAGDLAAALSL